MIDGDHASRIEQQDLTSDTQICAHSPFRHVAQPRVNALFHGRIPMSPSTFPIKRAPATLSALLMILLGTIFTPCRAGEFKLGDRVLHVPAGFVIETMAGPPLVDRPITAAFDE